MALASAVMNDRGPAPDPGVEGGVDPAVGPGTDTGVDTGFSSGSEATGGFRMKRRISPMVQLRNEFGTPNATERRTSTFCPGGASQQARSNYSLVGTITLEHVRAQSNRWRVHSVRTRDFLA
jgi:hypothetical protein